ncbi:MAG: hypothetical protein U0457_18995 [Candidatus Sericytochromatia bacterium]
MCVTFKGGIVPQEKPELKNVGKAAATGAVAAGAEQVGKAAKAAGEAAAEIGGKLCDQSKVEKNLQKDSVKPHPIFDDSIKEALDDVFHPEKLVENVRNSSGDDSKIAMMKFGQKIEHMPKESLKNLRDYLGKEMASPTNKDDKLLGAMLNEVNKQLDKKDNDVPFIKRDPFGPIKPVICVDPSIIKIKEKLGKFEESSDEFPKSESHPAMETEAKKAIGKQKEPTCVIGELHKMEFEEKFSQKINKK